MAPSSGVPDFQRASRIVIMEYAVGKLLYCHAPPHFDYDTFQRETLITAIRNTKKLRNKLVDEKVSNLHGIEQEDSKNGYGGGDGGGSDDDDDDDDENSSEFGIEDDDMLLQLIGDKAVDDTRGAKPSTTASRAKKWGKKGRKLRNKDPYGCHSTPDESLVRSTGITGVTVKGGKKHTRTNYVRPTEYGMKTAMNTTSAVQG